MSATTQERGWPSHYIMCHRCVFHRNTLVTFDGVEIVVGTVGNMRIDGKDNVIDKIGLNHYYETKVFRADPNDALHHDPLSGGEIYPHEGEKWRIDHHNENCDNEANDMHEATVARVVSDLETGWRPESAAD